MSVDCVISLPNEVQVDDVANVIALAAGFPGSWDYYEMDSSFLRLRSRPAPTRLGWTAKLPTADGSPSTERAYKVESSVAPQCAFIRLLGRAVDGVAEHYTTFHFEFSFSQRGDGASAKGMMPTSTPFWCAVGIKLVDFFGGVVDYNDCDDSFTDYCVPVEPALLMKHTNEEFAAFYERVQERVTPVTLDDMERIALKSAWPDAMSDIRAYVLHGVPMPLA